MINYFIYRLAEVLAIYLPAGFSRWLGIRVADLFYFFSGKNRTVIEHNLRIVLKKASKKRIDHCSRWVFRNFAKSLTEFLRFGKMDAQFLKRFVKIEGIRYFDQALARGKGVIAITAHLGNWELPAAVVSFLGYPLNVVTLPHRNRLVDNFFTEKRTINGIKVIPVGSSVKMSLSALRNNQILVLVGDRNFSKGGVETDFFNKPALMPAGIATLSLRFGSPIVPGFMIREKDDTFKLTFEKPIIYQPTGKRKQDLKNITREYLKVLEKYIAGFPEQWSIFSKVWGK
ncbi:MAG: lysophospholipid acyltransferase family protein [Candidatus Omnitrophota bacterium]|nr:lysophospholipid acyltransferase family protein [Candidatus Omnitrophota bacterium]